MILLNHEKGKHINKQSQYELLLCVGQFEIQIKQSLMQIKS